ncbi:MAG: sigma-54-dependent transcriptional regulator, partial [Acidobacteriota bacterium]
MSNQPFILVVDDEEIMREVITTLLEEEGYRVTSAATGEEGIEKVKEDACDLVFLDLMLPSMSGLEALEEMILIDPDIVVVMISAYASIETAVEATKSGAFDFITKPFKNEELLLVVKNGLKKRSLEIENRQLKKTLKERASFKNIVGKSEPMQQVFDLITQVAPRRSTVLIAGESGTGKELVARAIHSCSPRSNHAFVAVNSGSIPSDLLESELFGHVKGAFTGAIASKKGLFEIADGGTIFLDEVGTLPLETQSRLLRVIQEREFRQV